MSDAETAKAHFREGLALLDAGRFADAEQRFRDTLKLLPQSVPTLTNLAVALAQQGKGAEAQAAAGQAVALDPGNIEALLVIANCLAAERRYADALPACERILALDGTLADVHCNRGFALSELGRPEEALSAYDRAIALDARYAPAHLNRGAALNTLERHDEALTSYDLALRHAPSLPEAWLGRGNALLRLKRPSEALAAYEQALQRKPDFADALLGRGHALGDLDRRAEALASYDRALALKPDLVLAWLSRGNALNDIKRHDDALASYDRALKLDPAAAAGWLGRGNAFFNLSRFAEAATAYDRAMTLDPELDYAEGLRLYSKMQLCDWSGFADESAHLLAAFRDGRAVQPFEMLALPSSPADQLECATRYVEGRHPAQPPLALPARPARDRIRVAYLSGDLQEHPVGFAMAGVFERIDRARFEIFALSFGPDNYGETRMRLQRAFARFIDVRGKTDLEAAHLLRELEIDIAVDLMGHTAGSRLGILAHRGAPIQVSQLGFAGTTGAPYVDYIIADRTVAPEHRFFSEQVVTLPDAFFPTDAGVRIAQATPTRAAAGLPADGLVFCAFNNSYKIAPAVFDIWMRLLREVAGSVLWLSGANPAVRENLAREAQARGIAADRLVFAQRLPDRADHLARHRLADLFLDTFPYNAHTTACDALSAGLPVLTWLGASFAGRVAASLLHAAGLPELVANSPQDYEALALALARDPVRLAAIRAKLAAGRSSAPLFDTARYTRHLESAYRTMWQRQQAGERPAAIAVAPI